MKIAWKLLTPNHSYEKAMKIITHQPDLWKIHEVKSIDNKTTCT